MLTTETPLTKRLFKKGLIRAPRVFPALSISLAALVIGGLALSTYSDKTYADSSYSDNNNAPSKPTFKAPLPPTLDSSSALQNYLNTQNISTAPSTDNINNHPALNITLVEAIALALNDNLSIKTAYLGRVTERISLAEAEDKFIPTLNLTSSVKTEGGDTSTTTHSSQVTHSNVKTSEKSLSVGPVAQWLLPTGATVSMTWQYEAHKSIVRTDGSTDTNNDGTSSSVSLTQPLLKGGWFDVNYASIKLAKLTDKGQALSLSSTVESTLTTTITDYRTLIQSNQTVLIAQQSLANSQRNLQDTEAEIKAGRMPKADLVQYQNQIQQQKISLKQAQITRDNAKRSLALALGQSLASNIVPTETIADIDKVTIDFDTALAIALTHRNDYQQALLSEESAVIELMLAKNGLLWDLSLVAGYQMSKGDTRYAEHFVGKHVSSVNSRDHQDGWNVGLNLIVPLLDHQATKRAVAIANNALTQAKLSTVTVKQSVILDVHNALTTMNGAWDQLILGDQALQLAQDQYAIAKEKVKFGLSSTFEVISLDNELQSSKVSQLDNKIAYLNAITAFDTSLGILLDTWQIAINA